MPYSLALPNDRADAIKVVNIFPNGHWKQLAMMRLMNRSTVHIYWTSPLIGLFWISPVLGWTALEISLLLYVISRLSTKIRTKLHEVRTMISRYSAPVSWTAYHAFSSRDRFEQDYRQAWQDRLETRGQTVDLDTFIGKDAIRVPLLFDKQNDAKGNDRETSEMLRMWYCWMRIKRGFGEMLLPRSLVRIDMVEITQVAGSASILGKRTSTLELGGGGVSNVVNFEDPSRLPVEQRTVSAAVLDDPSSKGLEFVPAWDTTAVSTTSLMPFVLSLVFAAVWISVLVGKHNVDAQVATQTAFTVAAFIVTAGALLIALFAFLDTQAHNSH